MAPAHWREKAAKMRFRREQRQELVAGGLLADMIYGYGRIYFSMSHSDEVVMCVVSDRPVGCDVEKIVPLDEDTRREVGSIEAWVCREAVFKCGDPAAKARPVEAPSGYAAAVAFAGQVDASGDFLI